MILDIYQRKIRVLIYQMHATLEPNEVGLILCQSLNIRIQDKGCATTKDSKQDSSRKSLIQHTYVTAKVRCLKYFDTEVRLNFANNFDRIMKSQVGILFTVMQCQSSRLQAIRQIAFYALDPTILVQTFEEEASTKK